MKKILALVFALIMVLSLAACGDKTPAGNSDTSGTQQPTQSDNGIAPPGSGDTAASTEIENKVDLSLDKSTYEIGEHIAVTLDFSKLNQDAAVIVVMNSDTEHGKAISYDDETAWAEYRWLADFSEVPFYLYPQNTGNGLYDVRVYADAESGDELASLTIAIGNATLPVSGGQDDSAGGIIDAPSLSWPSIAYIKDADCYTGDGKITQVKEWDASGENSMWTVYFEGATFESVESYVVGLMDLGWENHYADEDNNYMENETDKGTARAYYCTCDYAEVEIQVANFSSFMSFTDHAEFSFNLSIQFSKS